MWEIIFSASTVFGVNIGYRQKIHNSPKVFQEVFLNCFHALAVNLYQQNLFNKGDSYSVYACHFLKLLISAKFPLIDQIKFLITYVAAGAG